MAPDRPGRRQAPDDLGGFLAVAFGITWLCTAPLVASHQGWIGGRVGTEWHPLGALGPLLAALWVARRSSAAAGHLRAGATRWRVSGWYYLAALSPVVLLLPAAGLVRLVDGVWPSLSGLGDSPRLAGAGWLTALAVPALAYAVGEELGWRGTALPRLQARFAPLTAALVLGGIWVGWHLPFYLYREGMADAAVGEQVGQGVVILVGSLFLAWLYNSTGGSIALCALWHLTHSVVHVAVPEVSPAWDTYGGVLGTILSITVTVVWWRRMSVHRTVTFPAAAGPVR